MSILGTYKIITLFQVGKDAHLEFIFQYKGVEAHCTLSKTDFRHFSSGRLRHEVFSRIIGRFADPEINRFASVSKTGIKIINSRL
jgi:hypothetical protein